MAAQLTALVAALLAIAVALYAHSEGCSAWLSMRFSAASWHTPDANNYAASDASAKEALNFGALSEYADANSARALRWGTYRSGLYLGLRSRSYPYYVSAGLLWGSTHEDVSQLRHECRQEDRLQKYGWLQHDGRQYGRQSIEDQFNRVELTTTYLRLHADDGVATSSVNGWASRVAVAPLEPRDARLKRKQVARTRLSLFFYVDLGCGDESIADECHRKLQNLVEVASEASSGAPCGADEAFMCTRMTMQSDGLSEEFAPAESAPLAFQVLTQLKTRRSVDGASAGAVITKAELRYSGLKDANVVNVKDKLVALAERAKPQDDLEIVLDNIIDDESTLVVLQAIVEFDATTGAVQEGDIVLDVVFQESADSAVTLTPAVIDVVDTAADTYRAGFEARFDAAFPLQEKGYNSSEIAFAQAAFSNLIGGLGYFYGSSLVQHEATNPAVVESAPKPLFSAVPSRSFFPRGFLWDEGFHQIGIGTFDEGITRDVLVHWLGLMEDDGYIAREQILGQTARRRVPSEFLVQHVEHANPPALLLALERMVATLDERAASSSSTSHGDTVAFIKLIFPFLLRWHSWFVTTQQGPIFDDDIASFRWRGRRADDGKLIANTLSSGLDDYPRASLPSEREMHLDLLCWMIKANDVLAKLAAVAGLSVQRTALIAGRARLVAGLETLHWHEASQSFFDVGDHSEDGQIEKQVVVRCRNEQGQTRDTTAPYAAVQRQQVQCPPSHPTFMFPLGDGKGGLSMQPVFIPGETKLQHVRHIGYVSVFPLLLHVLPADSPRLEPLLQQLAHPEHLWSPFGLRSMSTRDLFYEQENAHGDNPYWRGSIWINMNYLALRALHHYAFQDAVAMQPPVRALALEIYAALRENIVRTIYSEYLRTGYLWEQYSGDARAGVQFGRGQRCHPFSGWTALIVNIMAEKY